MAEAKFENGVLVRAKWLGAEDLTVSNASVGLASEPSEANSGVFVYEVLIQEINGQPLRFTGDGTVVTASTGTRLAAGASITLLIDPTLLRFIREGGSDAKVNVTYLGRS